MHCKSRHVRDLAGLAALAHRACTVVESWALAAHHDVEQRAHSLRLDDVSVELTHLLFGQRPPADARWSGAGEAAEQAPDLGYREARALRELDEGEAIDDLCVVDAPAILALRAISVRVPDGAFPWTVTCSKLRPRG